jgi:hypothetical protein
MLGTLQAGVLLSRLVISLSSPDDRRLINSLTVIKNSRSTLLILISIAAVSIISIISSLFSILPHQSWWGRNPAGFEAGEYTALMYVVLSISAYISASEFKSGRAIWRAMAVTGVLAGLVGVFQFFDLSPLGISSSHNTRITGTNGNPIFFGALLVLLAPITLSLFVAEYQSSSSRNKRWWLIGLALAAFVLMLSLVATVSRGPWLGAFTGGLIAFALLLYFARAKANVIPIATIVIFAIFGGLIATFVDPTPPDPPTAESPPAESDSKFVTSAFNSVGRTNTLSIRISYWEMSAKIAAERNPVPFTNDAPTAVRWLFGYGPDTFRYAGTYFITNPTFTRRLTAAHNDPINRLVEQGMLGLIAWLSLWASLAIGMVALVRRVGSGQSNVNIWIVIGISAALTGRFVEQMFGSPTPGGVLIFWIIVGVLAAHTRNVSSQAVIVDTVSKPRNRTSQIIVLGALSLIMAASATLGWDRGINYLIANQIVSFQYGQTVVSADEAIERLEKATKLAPDVARYWHDLAEVEHGRAAATTNPQIRSESLLKAYEYDLKAYEVNPLEISVIYDLAFSAWEAAGDDRPELRQQTVELYEKLTIIFPADQLAKERLETLREFLAK